MADKNKPTNLNLAFIRNKVILKGSLHKKVSRENFEYVLRKPTWYCMEHCHEVVAQQPQIKTCLIFKSLNSSLILH